MKKIEPTWDDLYNIKFRDTYLVRRAVLNFEEKGSYCPYSDEDPMYMDWWEEEERKSIYGDWFPIGPHGELVYISGYHYWYLNYCPMMYVSEKRSHNDDYKDAISVDPESGEISYTNYKLIQADRIKGFPHFWDGDYWYFKYIDDAEKAAKFGIVLKRRGVGASYKTGGLATRNYFLIPGSNSFLIADDKSYLTGDGVLQKTWDMMHFIDKNTAFSKRRQFTNTQMERRASFREVINGVEVERGYLSSIIGITTKNDPGKVRGIRGKLIYLEEAGADPYFMEKFRILINSVKQGRFVYGFILGAGTGGQEGQDYKGLNEIWHHPDGFNCYGIPNVWDTAASHKLTGLFWPVHLNYEGFIDGEGNSDMIRAAAFEREERAKIEANVTQRHTLQRHKSENPFTPQEATLNINRSVLPVEEIINHLNEVETNPLKLFYGTSGVLVRNSDGTISFKMSNKVKPIDSFPHDKKQSEDGAIVIYDHPNKIGGVVPPNLYLITNDPYYQDKSTGPSLGATFVYKKVNNIDTFRMDTLVAAYVGRPQTLEQYLNNMFLLAEYYNARIAFENDKGKSVIEYARRTKKLHMLQPEFDFKYNVQIPRPSIKRGFGMKMGSGKDDPVRNIGEQYLADWLLRERSVTEDGTIILTLHTIYDIPLLQELSQYDGIGNFDRVDALIQLMYFIREVQNVAPMVLHEEEKGSIFDPQRIAGFYKHEKWY